MDREKVSDRMRSAWDTLRRVPSRGVPGYRVGWPEVIQDHFDAYGYTAASVRLPPAEPRAIDRMNETFGWFRFVANRDLVDAMWLCCGARLAPRRVAKILGLHRNTVMNRRNAALDLIVRGLACDVPNVPQSAVFAT